MNNDKISLHTFNGLQIQTGDLLCMTDGSPEILAGEYWRLLGKLIPGAIDHVALEAQGFDEMKKIVLDYGAEWRQNRAPSGGLWQLFVKDPSGVTFELNFPTANEPEGSIGPDESNRYITGRF